MRNKVPGFVTVRAVSGTHVIFLAFDMAEEAARGLMGFAIQRTDLTEQETWWLKGNKTFPSIRPSTGLEDASSLEHPFQAFQWADYSAKPGYRYNYRVVPMYGKPGELTKGDDTNISIETEPLAGATHEAYFNTGGIASQAFFNKFKGKTLEEAGQPAQTWLTRDLLPGMLAFIRRAADARYSLHAAIYELRWPEVLLAFKAAADAGAEVKLLYHAKDDATGRDNEDMIDVTGIRALVVPRSKATIMHNKFIVLSHDGQPLSTWTGSTNLSPNALFGQLNVGHVIHDQAVGQAYLDYWVALEGDPLKADLKDWTGLHNPLPPAAETDAITPVFSPHRGRPVFEWWINLAATSGKPLFMTFPFGIVADFRPVYDKNDGILRFALLDKYVNGGNAASRATAIADIERIRRHPNIGMALGKRIYVSWIDGWHPEHSPLGLHVNWVHTKFMLIDPLGDTPVTLTGSANWSESSVTNNDENLVVIRGDQRVADIYFGEFMRIFAHHRFRESIDRYVAKYGQDFTDYWKPQDLFEDWKKWVPYHFKDGSEKDIKRRYFADVS
jgi:phosphatidylserine/phosphatidylglycerophosphate/cardiolipin synthase-like enzyme